MTSRAVFLPFSGQPRLRAILFLAMAASFGTIVGCGSGTSGSTPPTNGTPPTNLAYPQTTISATVGQAISADNPTVTGSVTAYNISPALSAGLSLNASTGAITGTPTSVTAQATYTITATNSAGITTTTVQIVVNATTPPPTNLVYPQASITATVGQAISTDAPTVTGTVTSYSVSPILPAGLSLSASTGTIAGTPTTVTTQATYTITATNSVGVTTATVQIAVNAASPPPANLVYPQTSITATVGQAISTDTPTVTGTVTSYSVSPALPAGFTLSASTGTIAGTPTTVTTQATYTITATNSVGVTTATVQITVSPAPPANLAYPQASITATVGQAISTDTPTVTGTVTSYSVSPILPAGLSLSASTGTIAGTPTTVTTQATYTITATNSVGVTTATVQITVNATAAPPTSLVYPQTTIVASVGQTMPPDMPVLTGDPAIYTVSPAMPFGISVNSVDGTITGVPTAPSPQTTYTVTASNSGGSTTATIAITVNKALPVLLDIGHANQISMLRVSATRVLSQDLNNHWVLWDYPTNTKILSGDQVVPPFVPPYSSSIFSWPVDMAGQVFVIGQTNGLDVRATSDGHVLFELQSPQIDSVQGGTWWKLATDGSYICDGSQGGLTIWSSAGQQLLSLPGDYSTANAYAAPGQLLIALGPAGQNVIQTVSVPSGATSTGPAFSGTFNSWFTDGQNFFTATGTSSYTVNTYSSANTQLQSSISLPTIENLTGQGNWFWTYQAFTSGYPLNIYPINSSTPSTTLALDTDTVLIPSGNTIGVLPFGTASASVIDLSGASPVKTDFPLAIAYEKAYAATSASQWLVGNVHGVVLDGTSASTTPRYFGTGQVLSIGGGTNYVAIATAIGKIFYYSPSSSLTTPVGTINFTSSSLALSSDGSILVAMANASDSQYETDRTLNVYSLPSGNLIYSTPYQLININPGLFGFSLSGSGTVTGQSVCTQTTPSTCTLQAAPTTGGSLIWSVPTNNPGIGIELSPDGTLIAVSLAPFSTSSTTNIYQNGLSVTTVPGYAIGWIDNNQLLVNNYQNVQIRGSAPQPVYAGASIYSATGALSSSPTLPELYDIQPMTSTSIYAPSLNEILSLPSGTVTYSSTVPLGGPAAIAGSYVVFVSGSLVVTDTY
jgi:hypothetical protein